MLHQNSHPHGWGQDEGRGGEAVVGWVGLNLSLTR